MRANHYRQQERYPQQDWNEENQPSQRWPGNWSPARGASRGQTGAPEEQYEYGPYGSAGAYDDDDYERDMPYPRGSEGYGQASERGSHRGYGQQGSAQQGYYGQQGYAPQGYRQGQPRDRSGQSQSWRERGEGYGQFGGPGMTRGQGYYASQRARGGQNWQGRYGNVESSRSGDASGYAGYPQYQSDESAGGAPGGWHGGTEWGYESGRQRSQYSSGGEFGGRSGTWGGSGSQTGQQQSQRYGRGPKGYNRTDERIREEICDRMMAATHYDKDEIEVSVQGGEVTLSGTVCCRSDKFAAEETAESVMGVSDVINQLRVKRSEGSQGSQSSQSSEGRSETQSSENQTGGADKRRNR